MHVASLLRCAWCLDLSCVAWVDPKTVTWSLCKPAQSKCTHGHVARALLCENLQGKCGPPDGSRDRGPHFARACAIEMYMDMSQDPSYARITKGGAAPDGSRDRRPRFERAWAVEMHMDMSQEPSYARTYKQNAERAWAVEMHMDMSQEPSYARTYKQNAACHMDPETAAHTFRERAQSKCTWTCHKSHLMRELTSKMRRATWIPRPRPTLSASVRSRKAHGYVTRAILRENYQRNAVPDGSTHALCERAQSRCTWTCHNSHAVRELWDDMRQTRIPRPWPAVCASLRNRNTHEHQFYAANFNEKRRKTNWTLWSSTGLHSYHKNPSMWTRCLGKNRCKRNLKNVKTNPT